MSINVINFIEKWAAKNAYSSDSDLVVSLVEALRKEMDADYLGDLYRTDYCVTGRGAFPLDMLRYTSSWPKDETDVSVIEHSLTDTDYSDTDPTTILTVRLTKTHRDPKPTLAEDRWLSKFRWKVISTSVETSQL